MHVSVRGDNTCVLKVQQHTLYYGCSVLEVLLAESHLIGGLTGLGLSVSDAHSVVQIPVHSQAQSFAVDMRSQSVVVSTIPLYQLSPILTV